MTTPFRGWGPPPRPAPDRSMSYNADKKRLRITENGVTEILAVDDISFGETKAIRLVAINDDLAGECVVILKGRASECDCPHGLKFGHRVPCAHVAALLSLQRRGLIQ